MDPNISLIMKLYMSLSVWQCFFFFFFFFFFFGLVFALACADKLIISQNIPEDMMRICCTLLYPTPLQNFVCVWGGGGGVLSNSVEYRVFTENMVFKGFCHCILTLRHYQKPSFYKHLYSSVRKQGYLENLLVTISFIYTLILHIYICTSLIRLSICFV